MWLMGPLQKLDFGDDTPLGKWGFCKGLHRPEPPFCKGLVNPHFLVITPLGESLILQGCPPTKMSPFKAVQNRVPGDGVPWKIPNDLFNYHCIVQRHCEPLVIQYPRDLVRENVFAALPPEFLAATSAMPMTEVVNAAPHRTRCFAVAFGIIFLLRTSFAADAPN